MIRKILTASIASAAIAIAGPALAGPGHSGGGAGGPHGGGVGSAAGTMGTVRGNSMNAPGQMTTAPTTNPAAGVSQGPAHASVTGIAHANAHSVLASGAVPASALPGLTTQLNVTNANGTSIGTVSQIVTDSSGNIRLVIVTSPTGQTFRLSPTTLAINGGMVTTTSTIGG